MCIRRNLCKCTEEDRFVEIRVSQDRLSIDEIIDNCASDEYKKPIVEQQNLSKKTKEL
jgi:hypothetical protein